MVYILKYMDICTNIFCAHAQKKIKSVSICMQSKSYKNTGKDQELANECFIKKGKLWEDD